MCHCNEHQFAHLEKLLSGLINKLKTRNEEILISVIFIFTNDKSISKYQYYCTILFVHLY